MDDADRLKGLQTRRDNILTGMRNIERDIAGAENALLNGESPQRLVLFLRERNADLRDHAQDLGAVEARIEDLRNRQQEQGREPAERQDAQRAEARNLGQEQPWYKKASTADERPSRPDPAEKPRNWFERKNDQQEDRRQDDQSDRDRQR